KKKKSEKSKEKSIIPNESEEDVVVNVYDPEEYKKECDKIISDLQKKLQEMRMGNTEIMALNGLKVKISQNEIYKIMDIAQVSNRGRKSLTVSVYDQSHVKSIASTITAAGLNMNPQIDPGNPQTLVIPIPAPTKESRESLVKAVKAQVDNAKSAKRNSILQQRDIAYERYKMMVKAKYPQDLTRKVDKQIEKITKDYSAKLVDIYEQTKSAIMNA
ncbi:ribosome recycling factor-domain-containing protein, partial [Dipodascopsis uninucleata]